MSFKRLIVGTPVSEDIRAKAARLSERYLQGTAGVVQANGFEDSVRYYFLHVAQCPQCAVSAEWSHDCVEGQARAYVLRRKAGWLSPKE